MNKQIITTIRSVTYTLALFFLSYLSCLGNPNIIHKEDIASNNEERIKKAAEALNHANTYYWYGRYKQNLLSEFVTSKKYIDTFNVISQQIVIDTSNVKEINDLKRKGAALDRSLKTIIPEATETANGRIPIYMELLARNSDNVPTWRINQNIVITTLDNLVEIPYFMNEPLKKTMLFDILLLKQPDSSIYETTQKYFALNTNHYLIGLHEISEILGRNNDINMSESNFSNDEFKKIADFFNTDKLGLIKIRVNDINNGLYYYGSEFSTWNKDKNTITNTIYAEGFNIDKVKIKSNAIMLTIVLVLVIMLIIIVISLFWKERRTSEDFKTALFQSIKFTGFSLITGIIVIFTATIFLGRIAPGGDFFYLDTKVRFGFQGLIGIIFVIAPIALNYILILRLFGETFHRTKNLFAFFAGSLCSSTAILFYHSYCKFGSVSATVWYFLLIPIFLAFAYLLAIQYKEVYSMSPAKKIKETASIALLLLSAIFIPAIFLTEPDKKDFLFIIASAVLFTLGLSLKLFRSKRIATSFKLISNKVIVRDVTSLRKYFSQPDLYITPSVLDSGQSTSADELFTVINNKLFSGNKENSFVIAGIVAPAGSGKTRLINEFIKMNQSRDLDANEKSGKINIYYGDCDEVPAANAIPYEPFVQALGDELGVNRFMNPQLINSVISEKIKNVPSGAVSAFASIIGGGKDGFQRGASENELARELLTFFKRNCVNNKVILVIEDIQWMDNDTCTLFEKLLDQIKMERDSYLNNLCILVTIRSDSFKDFFAPENLKQNRIISVLNDRIKDKNEFFDFFNFSDIISFTGVDYLNKQARFTGIDYLTTQKIQRYIDSNSTPMYINGLIISIIDRDWMKRENDQFTLTKDAVLSELPPAGNMSALFSEQLSRLEPEILQMLEIAAFIGVRFHTKIVAFVRYGSEIFEQKLLDVYYLLQIAEKLGLIVDDTSENDAYEFTSKQLVSVIKDKYRRNRKEHDAAPTYLFQVVREYNKRIFHAYLYFYKEVAESNPELIQQLALLSRSFDVRESSDLILKFNEKAGDIYASSGNIEKAASFYKYLWDEMFIEKSDPRRFKIIDKLFQVYLEAGFEKLNKIVEIYENEDMIDLPAGLTLKYLLALNRTAGSRGDKEGTYAKINSMLSKMNDADLSLEEQLRQRFIKAHSGMLIIKEFSSADKNFAEWKAGLEELVEEIKKNIQGNDDLNNLYGEVLNTLALSYVLLKPPLSQPDFEAGKELLDKRMLLLLKIKDERKLSTWDDLIATMNQCLNLLKDQDPILSRHDRESLKFLFAYYKDLFINASEPVEKSLMIAELALEVNRVLIDYFGIMVTLESLIDLYNQNGDFGKINTLTGEWVLMTETLKMPELVIRKAKFTTENQLHCLRHFEIPDQDEIKRLASVFKISEEEIKINYEIPGSRFISSFAKTPDVCFNLMKKYLGSASVRNEYSGVLTAIFEFPKNDFKDGIGYTNVISIEQLSDDDQKRIKYIDRDGVKVGVISSEAKFITWKVVLVVDTKNYPSVATMYPGEPAPPLPDPEALTGDELEESRNFWETHVFKE
jgi:hypothetical protein